MKALSLLVPLLPLIALAALASAQVPGKKAPTATPPPSDPEGVAFFENKIRPVLAQKCLSCHGAQSPAGGLRLDDPALFLGKSFARGVAVKPGAPAASVLLRALRYNEANLRMPPTGKLPDETVRDFETWIARGAPVPAKSGAATGAGGFSLAARRNHWSYRKVVSPAVPTFPAKTPAAKLAATWTRDPIDSFVLQKLAQNNLAPAPVASRATWIRRVTFDLTGLPPTPGEITEFLNDRSPRAYGTVVDRLLASSAYGERWGRHWLDLVRYGESMGHELDFEIPNAFQYRDAVIRAFNADVPYDRLVREHLAGDLLPDPRRDPKTGANDSLALTGFWWLGEGKHSPVDVRQEQADRIDNQIDVFGKAFLSQTIACARCHDHKFDPIPTRDYYALYGVLASSRYEQAIVSDPAPISHAALALQKIALETPKEALATRWKEQITALPDDKLRASFGAKEKGPDAKFLPEPGTWIFSGPAFGTRVTPGAVIASETGAPLGLVARPGAAHSAVLATRLDGALRSHSFVLDSDFLHVKVAGQKGRLHLIVEDFQVIRDPIYGPLSRTIDTVLPGWVTIDVKLWKGRRAYIEMLDSALSNLSLGPVADPEKPFSGWVRCDAAALSDSPKPPVDLDTLNSVPFEQVRPTLCATLDRWATGLWIDSDFPRLDVVERLLLSGQLDISALAPRAKAMAETVANLPIPIRAPALTDGDGTDEKVFVRGSHKSPGADAPRLQLASLFRENAPSPKISGSGRAQLAAWLTDGSHPLFARSIVNRLWHHHFGRGIVATVDDFGHMGEAPTHPELLDYLASEFARPKERGGLGFSLKALHRRIVLSPTYRMDSVTDRPGDNTRDPQNKLLHRQNIRRLEGEAIRDSMLAVSGRLNPAQFGPSIPIHLTEFTEGRGRPAQGPIDGDGRRSVYLAVRRNFLSPWLLAFDFPTPFTCIGRRTVSNVPAQALALLNGPFVKQQADRFADRVLAELPNATTDEKIDRLYALAFGRKPAETEREGAKEFLGDGTDIAAWRDFAHVCFNVKEFVFVR